MQAGGPHGYVATPIGTQPGGAAFSLRQMLAGLEVHMQRTVKNGSKLFTWLGAPEHRAASGFALLSVIMVAQYLLGMAVGG